jgi:hypothetical protein
MHTLALETKIQLTKYRSCFSVENTVRGGTRLGSVRAR